MCDSLTLTEAPLFWRNPRVVPAAAAAAGGAWGASALLGQPRASAPLSSPTPSGCLSRANNALSVGDCLTVNNVSIA